MNKFEALGFNNAIVKAVTELGFENPTPIQEKVIPVLLKGNTDLVALAQTGTGKTAAFGLPLTHLIDFTSRDTQAVIICPTRELCMQITRDFHRTAYLAISEPWREFIAIDQKKIDEFRIFFTKSRNWFLVSAAMTEAAKEDFSSASIRILLGFELSSVPAMITELTFSFINPS